jgi:hypothetical protein
MYSAIAGFTSGDDNQIKDSHNFVKKHWEEAGALCHFQVPLALARPIQ